MDKTKVKTLQKQLKERLVLDNRWMERVCLENTSLPAGRLLRSSVMTLRLGNVYIQNVSQRHRTEQNGDLHTTNTYIRQHYCVCVYIQTHLHSTIQMGIAIQHSATTILYGVSDPCTCLQPHSPHAFHHYPASLVLPSQQVTPPLYLLTLSSLHLTLTLTLKSLTTLKTIY